MECSQPTNIQINHGFSMENIDIHDFQKMAFIYNALDEGWQVIKKTDRYIFTKKHEGRKEVLSDDYLRLFIVKNFSLDKLIN